MSNHVWECPHGVERGQGCHRFCPICDAHWIPEWGEYELFAHFPSPLEGL